MGPWPINPFDAAIYICLFLAVVMGFMTGMLRSLATIFGYVAAMGIVVALAPQLAPWLSAQFKLSPPQTWIALAVAFVVAGIALGALLRVFINELVGPNVSIPDRVAGALLGALRVVLVAVVLVLVFDRIIPPGREPGFLKGSQWRPVLSQAGQQGLNSLPPEVEAYIDRLKKQRGL
ncbi:MAG TPA: CvpA family protein [Pseudolabrys sp.]|nr:CvpA family protein [Pseudolabrys sp.]